MPGLTNAIVEYVTPGHDGMYTDACKSYASGKPLPLAFPAESPFLPWVTTHDGHAAGGGQPQAVPLSAIRRQIPRAVDHRRSSQDNTAIKTLHGLLSTQVLTSSFIGQKIPEPDWDAVAAQVDREVPAKLQQVVFEYRHDIDRGTGGQLAEIIKPRETPTWMLLNTQPPLTPQPTQHGAPKPKLVKPTFMKSKKRAAPPSSSAKPAAKKALHTVQNMSTMDTAGDAGTHTPRKTPAFKQAAPRPSTSKPASKTKPSKSKPSKPKSTKVSKPKETGPAVLFRVVATEDYQVGRTCSTI